MWNPITNKKASQAGFTLVEIAVVMVIVGVLLAAGMGAYKIYLAQQKMDQTQQASQFVSYSLNDFKSRYGRYPCPARLDLPSTDPQYGRESDCNNTSLQPGNCADGLCVEISKRTVNINGVATAPRVRRGMLPFRDMLLDEDKAYDAYGGRFSYAVTEILTDADLFDRRKGGISIVDDFEPEPRSVVEPDDSGLYFVFSHGPDNVGAYNVDGQLLAECNGTMHDNENCNTSSTHREAVYRYKLRSDQAIDTVDASVLIPGAPASSVDVNYHYDDVADFKANTAEPIFKYSDTNENDAHDTLSVEDKLSVGIVDDANKTSKLNVAGNTKISESANTTEVCNQRGDDCIEPYLIGGTGMNCADNQVATGVRNGQMRCADPATLRTTCPSGQYIVAVSATGEVTCREVEFCTPYTVTRTNQPCPGGMSGSISYTETRVCPSGEVTQTQTGGSCVCSPSTWNSTDYCSDGSVQATYLEGFRCNGGTPEYYWQTLSSRSCPSNEPPNPPDPPEPPENEPVTRECRWYSAGGQRSGSFTRSQPRNGGICSCGTGNSTCYDSGRAYSSCQCR